MPTIADRRAEARRPLRRAGLTLLELMLALSLAGLLFLGARMLLGQLGDAGVVLARHAGSADAEANAHRLLHALVARADAGTDTARTFVGQPHETTFDSWCDRPAGWLERCRITLTLERVGGGTALLAELSTGERYQLRAFSGRSALRYLRPDAGDAGWLTSWGRSIVLPQALAVVSEGDTLILRLGERR